MQRCYAQFVNSDLLFGLETEMDMALVKQAEFSFKVRCVDKTYTESAYSFAAMREEAGLSQRQAARLLGATQSNLHRVELGHLLPSKEALRAMFDVYRIDRQRFATHMRESIERGSLTTPPVYALADKDFIWETEEDKNLIWSLTVTQWKNQVGVPLSFRGARKALGIDKLANSGSSLLNIRQQNALETPRVKEVDAHHIFYLCIAYRISPLSLLNGLLLGTLERTNMVLGGKLRKRVGYNKLEQPIFIETANEGFFSQLKAVIVSLGLIPQWQIPMFDSLILSTLAMFTRESKGLNQYLPFPLTPKNYRAWMEDPILQLYASDTHPESDFFLEITQKLPHDDLDVKDERQFYNYLIRPEADRSWITKLQSENG